MNGPSFNELLRRYRTRAGPGRNRQEDLGAHLGYKDPKSKIAKLETVGWPPPPRSMILDIGRFLALDRDEINTLLRAAAAYRPTPTRIAKYFRLSADEERTWQSNLIYGPSELPLWRHDYASLVGHNRVGDMRAGFSAGGPLLAQMKRAFVCRDEYKVVWEPDEYQEVAHLYISTLAEYFHNAGHMVATAELSAEMEPWLELAETLLADGECDVEPESRALYASTRADFYHSIANFYPSHHYHEQAAAFARNAIAARPSTPFLAFSLRDLTLSHKAMGERILLKGDIQQSRTMADTLDFGDDVRGRIRLLEVAGRALARSSPAEAWELLDCAETLAKGRDIAGYVQCLNAKIEMLVTASVPVDQEQVRALGQRVLTITEANGWLRVSQTSRSLARRGGVEFESNAISSDQEVTGGDYELLSGF